MLGWLYRILIGSFSKTWEIHEKGDITSGFGEQKRIVGKYYVMKCNQTGEIHMQKHFLPSDRLYNEDFL